MGLDITARSQLGEFIQSEQEPEPEYWQHTSFLYPNPDFPEQADGIKEGWYRNDGESHSFRAGSYRGYNRFRSMVILALHGVTDHEYWKSSEFDLDPLRSWLHFSDCEGVIGPETSKRLYREALVVQEKVIAHIRSVAPQLVSAWHVVRAWHDWVRAFELASRGGYVKFH